MPALKKKIISFDDADKNYFPLSAPDKRYPAELAVFQNIFWQLKHEKAPKDDVLKILFLFSPKVRLAEDPHEGMEFCITAKEYAELTGLKVDSTYTILNRVVDALYDHSVVFYHSEKDRDIRTRLINSCSYKDGCFYISFTHFALYIMYVFNQQNSFTKFKVKSAISLSGHGLKLYPFLIQNEFRYNFDVQLKELKLALGLNGDSYPEYRDFKTTILKPHIDSINQKTELTVEFKAVKKEGRKASHVNFTVTKKRTVKAEEPKKKVPDEPQNEQPKITATMVYKEIIKKPELLPRFQESGEAINEMIDRIKNDFKNGNQERWINKLQEFGIAFEEPVPF
ncbi:MULTISPECIES: replication initiation protein [Acinetobacter]|jgi:plasmid replication initiation protein|uniref:RepB family plasmid replication initiator protein n=1 Tax=Acinetobacter chengduensis TaxID=2420890 RepID=A0ABX9TR62_9GAMM|nr:MULTISPECIES: replication initiation protein [Acinetobacter]RLL17194.1 RepB family plasmid replication initiator protein [Acinetobacter chengduensis]